jgi:hypothetical protein
MPSRLWRIYFYYHAALAVVFSVVAILDSRRYQPDHSIMELPLVVRVLAYCALGIVLWPSVLVNYIMPFLSLRLLWLARNGSPSFIAFALCDTFLTIVQYLALLVACS